MKIALYTTDPTTGYERRIADATGLQWFSHYGPDGSGFGYLTFRLRRRVGFTYADLGYGYRVRIYKGPWKCLFDGQITRITERATREGDEIEVYVLGWVHAANADIFNRVYLDGRYNQWVTSEKPSGHFQPQKFSVDTADHLYLKPRQGSTEDGDFVATDDYTMLRYTFPFGENAALFTADYEVAFPGSFPAEIQIWAGDVKQWSVSTSESGTLGVTGGSGAAYFEVRLVMTQTGDVTAEDDTVYALFENVKVYSVTPLEQKTIADDIAAQLSSTYHGLSSDTRMIASPGFPLTQATFDTDQTPAEVLSWICQFGDADGVPVAWGVSFDDQRRMFLESFDLQTVRYTVAKREAESIERSGDWSESAQVVYGIYTDVNGQAQRTADYASVAAIGAVGGYYRRQAIDLSGIPTAALAGALLSLFLNENGYPKMSGAYSVKMARTPDGRSVPCDELLPGGLVQVREFRALEAEAATSDYRDKTTTFMLYGVTVNADEGTAELMPEAEGNAFDRQMAIIQHLLGQ